MLLRDRYVDLLMASLTRSLYLDEEMHDVSLADWDGLAALGTDADTLRAALRSSGTRLSRRGGDPDKRQVGHDWPPTAETMVGVDRLADVRRCVESVLADGVPGDLIETGVWRGGVTILMKGILQAWAESESESDSDSDSGAAGAGGRTVWVADSFEGIPAPDADAYPADAGIDWSGVMPLKVGVDVVKKNFDKYGLLDEGVQFLLGWFSDTLPSAPIEQLAVLRLDGDLYESTMDALVALEPKVADGGYVLVDDYGAWEPCRKAVDDYRRAHNITAEIVQVDWTGVHWRVER